MARQDIQMDAAYGEVDTTDNLTGKAVYDFTLIGRVEGLNNELYTYGEIAVDPGFAKRYTDGAGIHVNIPYTPSYKQLMVRFRVDHPGGDTEYLINAATNRQWFQVCREEDSGELSQIRLAEFGTIDGNGNFNLLPREGFLALYSGDETDLVIGTSLRQNEVFLLKAFAGNIYQFPTTGVGLIEFLHGNFENSGLADRLQSEFESDKMIIQNAYMNSETGEMLLEVTEKDG